MFNLTLLSYILLTINNNNSIKTNNYMKILKHDHQSYNVVVNKYINLTEQEFGKQVKKGCYNNIEEFPSFPSCKKFIPKTYKLPESIDWRDHEAVTSVKDQGNCGSCWSFSATGAIESAWAIQTDQLIDLSEQQIMDCSKRIGGGCSGGMMDTAFQYAIQFGVCSEKGDPYEAKSEICDKSCKKVVHISNCADVTPNNQLDLKAAVAMGPVSVAIEADTRIFQFYSDGVITDHSCGTNLDHGVLIVGYGIENGISYWLVKNSWGSDWGEEGYVKIGRSNSTNDPGICGIAMKPSLPIV